VKGREAGIDKPGHGANAEVQANSLRRETARASEPRRTIPAMDSPAFTGGFLAGLWIRPLPFLNNLLAENTACSPRARFLCSALFFKES
jgi:hypothetical protein